MNKIINSYKYTLLTILIVLLFLGCGKNSSQDDDDNDFEIIIALHCDGVNTDLFDDGIQLASIVSPPLSELSGLAASIANPGYYWTHNDSGNAPHLYLLDSLGNLVATFRVPSGNFDWEDMACVISPYNGKSYVYIADFGDNLAIRSNIKIIELPEPNIADYDLSLINELPEVKNIIFEYPDGAKDAETLLIDPWNLDLYIASKREANVRVYISKYPYNKELNTLEHIATLPVAYATAGDINPAGNEILIRTTARIYYWKRNFGEPLKYTFRRQPLCLPSISEPQGEAICFAYNNSGYYTVSEVKGYENLNVTFNYFKRK